MSLKIRSATPSSVEPRDQGDQPIAATNEVARSARPSGWLPTVRSQVASLMGVELEEAPPAPPPVPRKLSEPVLPVAHQSRYSYQPVRDGRLFVAGVDYDDVTQGALADCFVPAATSAVAWASPETIAEAIVTNADGTFTVRFWRRHRREWTAEFVTVGAALPSNAAGHASYARARDPHELWPAIIEKAYAQWMGGYNAIGSGGAASAVIRALTRRDTAAYSTTEVTADRLFEIIDREAKAKHPMTAVTDSERHAALYANTGVHADHTYTVTGTEVESGRRYVLLRNPWGSSEPANNGRDDGNFRLTIDEFRRLFISFTYGGQ